VGNYAYVDQLSNSTIAVDTWTHVGFTCSRNGDVSTVTLYINGEPDGVHTISYPIANPDDYVHLFSWARDGAQTAPTIFGHYKPLGYMNDFRIYDHCLSPREVKLLAQGLVAHYPLKAPFLPNLLQGAEQYTKESPLVRNVADVSQSNWYDSSDYHTNVTANIKRPGRYLFVLNADGIPADHNTTRPQDLQGKTGEELKKLQE
jgi:hypothetical protein